MGRLKYSALSVERIKPNRNIVISEAYNEEGQITGYSVSEQLEIEETDKITKVFLKNGFGIMTKEGLQNMKVAIEKALENIK